MESNGAKFLFNVYIPRGKTQTTEIDVLMICPKGIFVFESKNYSGWIFGNETQKYWCQSLKTRRGTIKKHFYNPIIQNQSHIKHLKNLIGKELPMYSIIAFSERCTLKNEEIKSINTSVIKRYEVPFIVSHIYNNSNNYLSESDIAEIYNKLYPYTQLDEKNKFKHINNIRRQYKF